MIYLDNAATTLQKPQAVYDAVYDAMKTLGKFRTGIFRCGTWSIENDL